MKRLLFAISIFILICGTSSAQIVSSGHAPKVERLQHSIIIPYDVEEFEQDGVRVWEYKELRIPDQGQSFTDLDATIAVTEQLTKQTAAADAAALLAALSYSNVDTHVDTAFASLSTAQKTSLKKLYKAVLYLLKQTQS